MSFGGIIGTRTLPDSAAGEGWLKENFKHKYKSKINNNRKSIAQVRANSKL